MAHTIRDRAKLLARVKRIQGQTAALEKLLESGAECAGVLQQIAAVRGAVNGLMGAVIEGHLHEHIVQEASPQQREEELEAVLRILKSYLK